MRKPIHIVFSFISLFVFAEVLFAQPQNAVAGIDAVMKQYDVPGLSVAVVKTENLFTPTLLVLKTGKSKFLCLKPIYSESLLFPNPFRLPV